MTSTLTLAEKVALLRDPHTHALPAQSVIEVVETRMSWLFLTPERVYKLKKPLREPLFDFSTLARRRLNCETELRLNRIARRSCGSTGDWRPKSTSMWSG
ncbi:MAG TPA: hypothetical protein PKO17_07000 [Pseudomonadales bacterium]|jgi:aminoglycoside phosphotransferase family enzyme|nr:hypothetical protein [Pseudomonadales bacterium]